ncbi:MAG: zinc metallopeptidase [Ruminococcaceae bacterium]|nr:zinc metallopeptidase [Oscillospiraceae bacterium]
MLWYYDPVTYIILIVPCLIFALIAQGKVQSSFSKYSKVYSRKALTAAQTTRIILDENGLNNVAIEHVAGNLSDHYDPTKNVIRLSDSVYNSTSVAAIGVAAHEAGHAIQHARQYLPIKIRTAIIPITQIGSNLAMPLILIGLLMSIMGLAYVGIVFFALSTIFQLVTLPVEFNASKRAMEILESKGMLESDELKGAKSVLSAAAMTYVAALAVSLANLLRLILMVSGRRRR